MIDLNAIPYVIGCVGVAVSLLLTIIGYFLIRLIAQVDLTSKAVNHLSGAVEKLSFIVGNFEKEATQRHETVQNRFHEFHEQMEKVRDRIHTVTGYITAMRMQGELKNGWKFTKEWITEEPRN